MDPNWKPPTGVPHPPGTWVTLDAGKGQPPAWGYIPQDHGLGGGPPSATPQQQGGAQPPSQGGATPGGGHWVPVGSEAAQPKGGEPAWAYVPEIGASYGITPPTAQPK